jgi:(1->4)-alpha-D-glucan 1-alpha-D-glucosylmutase
MPDRTATYRWQLTPTNGFAQAAASVADLAALGISHLYLSPIAEAVPGSTHGYDAVDPTLVREELGGEAGLRALAEACEAAGLAIVIDIVPNHLAAHAANPWWWDVLRLGRRSAWAQAFDVDWDPPKRALVDTVLLPVLGDHYGRELEAGNLVLAAGGAPGRIVVVRYHEHEWPISPAATAAILAATAASTGDDVLGVVARVLARVEDDDLAADARIVDLAVAERTALVRLAEPTARDALDVELTAINADLDRLDAILAAQHHRLARWTVGDDELDYRRFFDVDTLVATRADRPQVFDALHALPCRLVADGLVEGLRIDHVDGLADPQAYLDHLRAATGSATWLTVEKILRTGEDLPTTWPVGGTTGYEVADLLGGWLTDPAGGDALLAGWQERVGEDRPFEDAALEARREVLAAGLAADVERIVDGLVRVCEQQRRHRDHSRRSLQRAVVEVAAHAPAYRSYVRFDAGGAPVRTAADVAFVLAAVEGARADPELDDELLDLLTDLLLGRLDGEAERHVALRFQQLTGPVAAKGEEDTAVYRWLPLPHRCEVGADPARPSVSSADWHEACAAAQRDWPERLTTLSTHDTKRSADLRARLAALTTVPGEALATFDRWWAASTSSRSPLLGADTGWLVFHVLVGAHPIGADRAWPVVEKSVREAGVHTSWTRPDADYEAALRSFVEASVDAPEVAELVERVAEAGDAAALAQLAAQLLAPGVPDVYQGGESWDRSLVDPDNRRGFAGDERRRLLDLATSVDAGTSWADPTRRASGLPRLHVLRAALGLRRRHPAAFGVDGAYDPLTSTGPDAGRVLAFARGGAAAVVAVRPGPGAVLAADAAVTLPEGTWTDALTGAAHTGDVAVAALTATFPVALLEHTTDA